MGKEREEEKEKKKYAENSKNEGKTNLLAPLARTEYLI